MFPPAFAFASPSLELGVAKVKAGGGNPLVEPELSPLFSTYRFYRRAFWDEPYSEMFCDRLHTKALSQAVLKR
jgi:hypothetical protein